MIKKIILGVLFNVAAFTILLSLDTSVSYETNTTAKASYSVESIKHCRASNGQFTKC